MDRRGFLGSILAACAAPAIVRADSLMRVIAADTAILRPEIHFSNADLASALDEFSRRYIQPAMRTLISGMEQDFTDHILLGKPLPDPKIVIARLPSDFVLRGPHG